MPLVLGVAILLWWCPSAEEYPELSMLLWPKPSLKWPPVLLGPYSPPKGRRLRGGMGPRMGVRLGTGAGAGAGTRAGPEEESGSGLEVVLSLVVIVVLRMTLVDWVFREARSKGTPPMFWAAVVCVSALLLAVLAVLLARLEVREVVLRAPDFFLKTFTGLSR